MDIDCLFSSLLYANTKDVVNCLLSCKFIHSLDTEYLWKLLLEIHYKKYNIQLNNMNFVNKYKLYYILVSFLTQLSNNNTEIYNELITFIKKYLDNTLDTKITCFGGNGYNEKIQLINLLHGLNPEMSVKINPKRINTIKLHNSNKKYIMINNLNYNVKNIAGFLKRMVSGETIYYKRLSWENPKQFIQNFKCIVPLPTLTLEGDPELIRRSHVIQINSSDIKDWSYIVDELLGHKEKVIQLINHL